MEHEFTTIKVWVETRRLLRLIAALTGESLVAALHRIATDELRKLEFDLLHETTEAGHA